MSDEIIDDYVITDDWGEDNALIFPDSDTSSGGNTPAPVVPPASFGPDVTSIAGTISWAQWGDYGGAFRCDNGTLTVPLPAKAKYASGTIPTSTLGLIGGVEFSQTDTTSEIDAGMIKLAAANASSHCDGTTDGTPGGIYGIGYGSGNAFSIDKGYIRIPKPAGHSFDPNWFTVRTDGTVTFNEEALAAAVVAEIESLNVSVHVEVDDVPIERIVNNSYTVVGNTDGDLTINTKVSTQ